MLGDSNMMAYLVMMAPRLVEIRRVLKPTGSVYLHCDPTAEATSAGFYRSPLWGKEYPRVQLLSIAGLLGGAAIGRPPVQYTDHTFKRAPRAEEEAASPAPLFGGR